jgi:predicted dehydrogenase
MTLNIVMHGCRHPHWRDYVKEIERTDGVRISHVWERDHSSLLKALDTTGAEKFDPAGFPPDISGIVLLSETEFHAEDVSSILPRHLPLFVEKPIGVRKAEVLQLAQLISEADIPFHIGFFLRAVPSLQAAGALIKAGQLGRVGYVRIRFAHNGVRAGWLRGSWIVDPKFAGVGGFADLAIHCIDLLHWWGFKPLGCEFSSRVNIMRNTEADDFGVGVMGHLDGTAVVEAGWAAGSGPMFDVEVLGSRGALRIADGQLVAELEGRNDILNLGAIELDAALGLRPFLLGIANGDWSGCVSIDEAVAANIATIDLTHKYTKPT